MGPKKDAGEEGKDGAKEEEKDDKKDDKKDSGGTVEMRAGDYNIHMYLEKMKELNVAQGDTMDPMIQLECLGQKMFSSAKDDVGGIGEVIWDEHIFLEAKGVTPKNAEDAKIEIRLMDKGMFKDKLIGQFDLDLTFVYLKPQHVLLHKWVALNNPNGDDYATIQAYVMISVAVTCTGDDPVQITENDGPEDTNVMMSPSLNPTFYQIKIRVFQGWDLPSLDSAIGFIGSDKIDAYMKLDFKGKKYKTKVQTQPKGGPPVHWNAEFWLPAQLPVLAPKINLKLMDHDDIGSDEIGGTLTLKTKEIIEDAHGNNGEFVWHNIYGAPLGVSNKESKLMNDDPDVASEWKGKVLLQILGEETDKPMAKSMEIEQDIVDRAQEAAKKKKYSLIAEVGQAVALPGNHKYNIQVIVGGERIIFKPFEQKNPTNYKRYGRIDQLDFESPFVDTNDFDKVIVQLMDGDKPVCFFKDDISKYTEPNATMNWYPFLPDMSVKKVKRPDQVGQFSFKLSLHDVSKDGPIKFKDYPAWKGRVQKRGNPVKIRCYIYQCRDLPAADSNGTSDPFVKVWDVTTTEKKTIVVEDNCNPLFYECLELDYEVADQNDLESFPPFIFDIYDHDDDLFDSTPDYLCRAIIEPEDCSIIMQKEFEFCKEHNQKDCNMCAHLLAEIPDTPRWHPCYYIPNTPMCGEILVSFAVADHDFVFPQVHKHVDLRAKVNFRDFEVNLLVLGLRDLHSPGILPVKKAFVAFNIKSLVPPNGPAVKNIQTEPTAPGPNPTLNTTMKFGIPLPTDPLYCPRLACTVYDCIFKGWSQPQIGTFDIPIGQLMLDLEEERTEETQIIEDINAELEKIILAAPEELPPTYSIQNKSPDEDNESEQLPTEIGRQDSEYSAPGTAARDTQGSVKQDSEKAKQITKKKKKKAVAAMKHQDSIVDQSEVLGPNEADGNINAVMSKAEQLEQVKAKKTELMAAVSEGSKHVQSPMNRSLSGKHSPRLSAAGGASPRDGLDSARGGSVAGSALSSKNELKEQMKQASELEKRLEADEKVRAKEEMISKGQDAHQMIVMPKYKLDARLGVDREYDPPSKTLYIGLGWDETSDQKRKHYRQYQSDELENNKEVFPRPSPFESYMLKKGKGRGGSGSGMFSTAAATIAPPKIVGKFKSIVQVANRDDTEKYQENKEKIITKLKDSLNTISQKLYKEEFEFDTDKLASASERGKFEVELRKLKVEHLNISKHLCNLESDEILKRALMSVTKTIVKFYAVSGYDMSSRDNGSASDTYLKLHANKTKFTEREHYQLDQPNPDFYKSYDFEAMMPGSSPLSIEVWDYDMIFSDELIGTTQIDLEDRYFCLEWNSLEIKPIEYRQLYHQSSSMSQGVVKCWLEINPTDVDPEEAPKEWDITQKPPYKLEVRVCIFNCEDVVMVDAEGCTDAYFRGFFDTKEDVQETDTHFRNSDGKPDFQYRLVYRIEYPKKITKFTIQLFDADFFSSNDLIGSNSVDISNILEDVSIVKTALCFNKKYYEDVVKKEHPDIEMEFDKKDVSRFWLNMLTKKDGKIVKQGKCAVQIDVMPIAHADKNPVAKARSEPNHSPKLPAPQGRLEFSFNPFKMLGQLVGPALRRKIYCGICCALCCALCVMILPNILGGIATHIITSI